MTLIHDTATSTDPDADGRPARGPLVRIIEVAFVGGLLAAWMGLAEALLLCYYRNLPEPAVYLQRTLVVNAPFGAVAGLLWSALIELVLARRGAWHRRPFYLVSLFVCILLVQLLIHTFVRWTPSSLAVASLAASKIAAAEALPATIVVVAAEGTIFRQAYASAPLDVAVPCFHIHRCSPLRSPGHL